MIMIIIIKIVIVSSSFCYHSLDPFFNQPILINQSINDDFVPFLLQIHDLQAWKINTHSCMSFLSSGTCLVNNNNK